ncbi:MAG: hypothetical protein EOO51_04770 [Flavobacterium sp.]|nr:MAG: hypothetical protein EOO51_04770 [Flavobacterium sp.]
MKSPAISGISRILAVLASVLFIITAFVPIWRIELAAPQYPEGLVLQLYASKIGGNVDIINGLNHYIGMKTLHSENFVEFSFLTYVIIAFGLAALLTGLLANAKALRILVISFIVFGILAALDFYRWNYQYGHDLDPNAAIQVPGMAYQPPLLGYKQLLNFGAYSIPDIGGWMMIAGFALLLVAIFIENPVLRHFGRKSAVVPLLLLVFVSSCSKAEPEPITLNKDNCSNCKMGISDGKFCAEAISEKGRIFKFDDIHCMISFAHADPSVKMAEFYVHDYINANALIPVSKVIFVKGGEIRSPMNGGIIALVNKADAEQMVQKFHAEIVPWDAIMKK